MLFSTFPKKLSGTRCILEHVAFQTVVPSCSGMYKT
jgi:hypothetical protein